MIAKRLILPAVAFIFLLSGGFALIYEVTWARMLSQEFGSDAVAIAIVVSVFMLGLGAGARLAGRWGDRLRNPLSIYGYMEVLLSIYVLVSPILIGSFSDILVLMGHAGLEGAWLLNAGRILLGMIALLPPTLLMGATLPILARFVSDQAQNAPPGIILFYAINTFGGVGGCLAGGFWLLPTMGMTQVLWMISGANLMLGAIAVLLSFRHGSTAGQLHRSASEDIRDAAPADAKLATAVALVGGASMACQLVWTRSVILVVGGSAYAFSAVLAIFLGGLGLGAVIASFVARTDERRSREAFLVVAALSAVALFGSAAVMPNLPGAFLAHFDAEQAGTRIGLMQLQLTIAGLLLLVPTTLMGMLFPLGLRIAMGRGERPASHTGRLYLANTAGTVAGALLAGFILIPQVGILATLLIAAGLIFCAIILVQADVRGPLGRAVLVVLIALGYGSGWYFTPAWDAQLMSSGISEYIWSYGDVSAEDLPEEVARRTELLYYRDGQTATVSVTRDRLSQNRDLYIATNGKIDGSSHFDMPTQKLSAHLPLLLHPAPERVAVIGLGTGVTAGSATLHDAVEQVNIVEIEPAMLEGARYFGHVNHQVLDSDKVRVLITDGRLHLTRSVDEYDVLISEPSNPWIAGIAALFTEEFYRLGSQALQDGGIFAQWLQIYNMETEDVRSVIASFESVFPNTYVAVTLLDTDLLLIGSKQPIPIDWDLIEARMEQPVVARDLSHPRIGVDSVEQLLAHVWMAPEAVESFVASAQLHRDDWPFLMYRAPLNRYTESRRRNSEALAGASRGLLPVLSVRGEDPRRLESLRQAYENSMPASLYWDEDD